MTADRSDEWATRRREQATGEGEDETPRPTDDEREPPGEVDEAVAAGAGRGAVGATDPDVQTGGPDAAAMQERYLRLAAEYDNYRKRTERERSESWVRAQSELVKKILEPLDDLQRVADFTVENTGVEALLEGVQMVERKLMRALESAGMEILDATGQPFDPSLHEALMTAPTEDPAEDDSVGEVFQKGYGFKGILLRPARVQVRKHEG